MKRRSERLRLVLDRLRTTRRHCEVLACISADPATAAVFARLARAKAELASELRRLCGNDGSSESTGGRDSGALASRCRRSDRLYRRWWPAAGDELPGVRDVIALSADEDRLLHRCEQWLAGRSAPALREALKRYLPQVSACHADLRRLCGEGDSPRPKAGLRAARRTTASPAGRAESGSAAPQRG